MGLGTHNNPNPEEQDKVGYGLWSNSIIRIKLPCEIAVYQCKTSCLHLSRQPASRGTVTAIIYIHRQIAGIERDFLLGVV
jgi:hypothetical protein